jgi:hypothetical protein
MVLSKQPYMSLLAELLNVLVTLMRLVSWLWLALAIARLVAHHQQPQLKLLISHLHLIRLLKR